MKLCLCIVLLLLLPAIIYAGGKAYWPENGVLVTGIDGMGIGDLVTDMRGGAYVVTGDLTHVYLIRVDKSGNLPWGLGGVTVDVAPGSALTYKTYGASDGKCGVIIVWSWEYTWGNNLYYQRIDSSGNKAWGGTGQRLTLSDSTQDYWQVVSDGHGGAIAAWQEQRNGQWDIYAQRVGDDPSGVAGKPVHCPTRAMLRLEQNRPNPFARYTMINYQLTEPGRVNLSVYNITGQVVQSLEDGNKGPGSYRVTWDGRNTKGKELTAGVYICRLWVGGMADKTIKLAKLQ